MNEELLEAAHRAVGSMKTYVKLTSRERLVREKYISDGFVAGAKWKEEEIWNDLWQYPNRGYNDVAHTGNRCLVCFLDGDIEICTPCYDKKTDKWSFFNSNRHTPLTLVHSWAYLDDITPIGFNK